MVQDVLTQGKVSLYHAMNLGGFAAYVHQAAILSRQELLQVDDRTPPFTSDESDSMFGALERTFGNWSDHGAIFARASLRPATPNIFGPIQVVFRPEVWSTLSDIIITPFSLVNYGSAWKARAMSRDEISKHVATFVETREWHQSVNVAEVSCSNTRIPFTHCGAIIVEPITLFGHQLVDVVRAYAASLNLGLIVSERQYTSPEAKTRMQECSQHVAELQIAGLADHTLTMAAVAPWATGEKLKWLNKWSRYFYNDTVQYARLAAGWHHAPLPIRARAPVVAPRVPG